jgi:hypothetical protein
LWCSATRKITCSSALSVLEIVWHLVVNGVLTQVHCKFQFVIAREKKQSMKKSQSASHPRLAGQCSLKPDADSRRVRVQSQRHNEKEQGRELTLVVDLIKQSINRRRSVSMRNLVRPRCIDRVAGGADGDKMLDLRCSRFRRGRGWWPRRERCFSIGRPTRSSSEIPRYRPR